METNDKETELKVENECVEEKTQEEINKRKALADKLVSCKKINMIYYGLFVFSLVILALMLVFAPILSLFGLNGVSVFNYLQDELLIETFKNERAINSYAPFLFFLSLFFIGFMVLFFLDSLRCLPSVNRKIKTKVENIGINGFISNQNENNKNSVARIMFGVVLGFFNFLGYGGLFFMPILILIDNKEMINWIVLAFVLLFLLLNVLFLTLSYYCYNKLTPEEKALMDSILKEETKNKKVKIK